MSVTDDFDAFRRLTTAKIGDAVSHLGESPTSQTLSAATNIVLSVLPQIENHYQQARKLVDESTRVCEETVKIRSEVKEEKSRVLREIELRKENHCTNVKAAFSHFREKC